MNIMRSAPPFQFHKGTIRTVLLVAITMVAQEFQFHKGTIRTTYIIGTEKDYQNFNSIKVRLELFLISWVQSGI